MDWGPDEVGELLRDSRVRARLTQQELADRAGMSVRAVRDIELGRVVRPRRASVRRLASALGITVENGWPRSGQGADRMRIGLLGRFEVIRGGQPVDIGPAKHRCLLALLAMQPNEVVLREEIVDVLWGDQPPASCLNLVQTYVSRLRKVIEPESGVQIVSERRGYRLRIDSEALDLLRFGELVALARGERDPVSVFAMLEEALRCWRGPLLADLPHGVRQGPRAVAVSARRMAAVLSFADAGLECGRHEQVVEHLHPLAHLEPLHEGLHARLMLALAGSGQQAAALRLFGEVRRRLADELGVEPGAEIRTAHLRILRHEPPAAADSQVPAQLPTDVAGFTGRRECLDRLDAILAEAGGGRDSAVVISAIAGTAGVGKTALAVHWAHRVRDRFPDGQLYLNLRGYALGPPVRPVEALTRFLHALGVPGERVPADEEEAAGLYRTVLADRRVLVVLDNAASVDQVRPLLPGSPGSLVLVTSRDRLAGLVVTEGARRITLDVLSERDARTLLTRMLGEDRVRLEPDAVAELARACAHLPLALRIASANLTARPHTGIGEFVGELRQRGRLAELAIDGDEHVAVRAAFDLSYAMLDPAPRRLFRYLGLVPGPDFTAEAAAALTAGTVPQGRRLLGQLAAAHLVHEHAAGRYQFHDLLREYAADRVLGEDGDESAHVASERLFDYYLHTADAATRLLYPNVVRMPLSTPARTVVPAPTTEAAAVAWVDTERPNLVAAARTHEPGLRRYTWRIADALRGYFVARGHGADGLAVCHAALIAARQAGDPHAEASVNDILGLIHYNLSDYAKATSYHSRALALNRRTENASAEAASLHNLGRIHSQLGKPAQARRYYEQALEINRRIGNRYGEAIAQNYVGVAWLSLGQPHRAIEFHTRALAVSKELGDRSVGFVSLNGLGLAHWALGQLDQAIRYHLETLAVVRHIGHRHAEVTGLVCIAETNCDAGRYEEAMTQVQMAITQSRQLGERRNEASGLDILATVHMRLGQREIAARHYGEALRLARELSFGYGQTSVLIGLAEVHRVCGRLPEALRCCHDALAVMHDSGMRLLEGRALTELASGYLELGDLDRATAHAERALSVVRERGQRLAEARALHALGLIRRAAHDPDTARSHWRTALEIFSEIGTPEAVELRALLGVIDTG